jgi:uncharacterized protein (TIGR02099 family)
VSLLLISAWSLLLLGWLILHWGILPHLSDWRPDIEQRLSRSLGLTVRMGQLQAGSSRWVPTVQVRDVVLLDPQGREALRLPRVDAALSLRSLLSWSLRLSQVYVEGARLDIRRDARGHVFVGGLDLSQPAGADDHRAADWFFAQPEFVIRGGQLRWLDEQRGAPPLSLDGVDLVVRNGLRHHDLRLDATPPAEWGQRFSLRGRFTQPLLARAGDWPRWSGTLYADLPHTDVDTLQRYASLPFDLKTGRGALRAWLDVERGDWRGGAADLALDAVQLRLGRALEPLSLGRLEGRLQVQRQRDGVRISAQGLGFVTEDGQRWPASQFTLGWRQAQVIGATGGPSAPEAPVTGGEFRADRLDLALMAHIAERLPLPDGLRRGLERTRPEGQVQDLVASWSGPLARPEHYRVQARATGLSLQPGEVDPAHPDEPARPGWRGAELTLDANESGGEGQLSVRDGALSFPGVFEQPEVPMDRLSAQLVWQVRPHPGQEPDIELLVREARYANPDLQGELQARWHTGARPGQGSGRRFPGWLDMTGRISQVAAPQVVRYLPLGIGHDARDYVRQAVLAGEVRQLQFRTRGDLWDFPYPRAGTGEFRIGAQLQGVTLAYVPPAQAGAAPEWPAFEQLRGELLFDRARMRIRNAQARLYGLTLQGVNGEIADLITHPVLTISGNVRGPLADGLRYVASSPVDRLIDGALHQASGTGAMDLKLALNIPLEDTDKTTVKGQLALSGNDVRMAPDMPLLAGTRAQIQFSDRSFSLASGSTRVLGGEASLTGSLQPDGSLRFQSQGVATAEGLRQAPEFGPVSRLAQRLSGQAPYKLDLTVRRGQTEMLLTSPLTGLSSELPAPLAKTVETVLPLRYQTRLAEPAAGQPERDTLRVELGNLAVAEYQRDLSGPQPQVLKGALAIGAPLPAATAGTVQAALQLGDVDVDAWHALGAGLGLGGGVPANGGRLSYLPTELTLKAHSLSLDGRRLDAVQAQVQHRVQGDGAHWVAELSARQSQGRIDYRPAAAGDPASGRLMARLGRLVVPEAEVDQVDSLLDQASDGVPALDIVVDNFELKGRQLGKLEVQASYRGEGGQDWRLSRLAMTGPDARLTGSGQWAPGPRRRMALNFKLDVQDGGNLLEHLGMGRVVKGAKGQVTGELAWNGSPLSPDWAGMTGHMQLALESGQFLKVNPGAGRLLGVLSLQALPRRFLLDFRDVFDAGFAFDNVSADVLLSDGIASTNNLRIRGVQAVVLMDGETDLRHETQDLRMVVVPEISAGTASLAYAAINPVIGLGAFLAQYVLSKPLAEAGTREFRVGGSWDAPTVVPVPRQADAAPVPASPASAASSPRTRGG